MDILAQLRKFLNNLSKVQKAILASVAGAVVVGLVLLVVLSGGEPNKALLYNNLEPVDASNITEYLKTNNIEYTLGTDNNGTTSIYVDKEKVYETRISLAGQGLPVESYVGYELFDKTNLGMSEFVQKLNYRRALEGELSRTIKSMAEIRDVKVHITLPEKSLLKSNEVKPTAAVKLTLKNRFSAGKLNVEGIQKVVASGVEGLTEDNVTITDNYGNILSTSIADKNTLAGLSSTQYEQQRRIEEYYSAKVQALLDPALGPDNSRVKLNTEIDFDQLQVDKTDYDPEEQVERSEQNVIDFATNVDTLFVPGVDARREKSNEIRNYEISKADSHYIKGIGGIKRMTVTAIVNEVVTVEKTPQGLDTVVSRPRTEEEINGLKEAIKYAVGFDERRGDEVNVLCVPFVEQIADKVYEVNEYNKIVGTKWWEEEENKKLLLLALALLLTAFVMWRILHAKFVKDKMRVAMGLPEKLERPQLNTMDASMLALPAESDDDYEDDEDDEEALEEDFSQIGETDAAMLENLLNDADDEIEELEMDDDEMLLLPEELPEQLLLEGDLEEMDTFKEEEMIESEARIENDLLARARSALSQTAAEEQEIPDDDLIKMELREKVYQFITAQPDVAVKIFRVFLNDSNS